VEGHVYGPPSKYIELRDSSIPYWIIGNGPNLIFVHGWPLDGRTWRKSVDMLKTHFTCHVIDLPRAGLSKWSKTTRLGVKAYGDILAECIEQMELAGAQFGLIGQNTGGTYARLTAAQMPERVLGLVLGNTEIPFRHSLHLRLLFMLGRFPPLETILRRTLATRIGRSSLLLMATEHRQLLHGVFTELFFRPMINERRRMKGAVDTLRALKIGDFNVLRETHGNINAPVKLVWGPQDIWFRKHAAQKMLAEFSGPADYVELSPGRIMIHEEQAERFANEIAEHFSKALRV